MDWLLEQYQNPEPAEYDFLLDKCIPRRLRYKLMRGIPQEIKKAVGKKIHLKSKRGIYQVLRVVPNGMILTCGTWRYDKPGLHERLIPFNDFKCLAGGKWNRN